MPTRNNDFKMKMDREAKEKRMKDAKDLREANELSNELLCPIHGASLIINCKSCIDNLKMRLTATSPPGGV